MKKRIYLLLSIACLSLIVFTGCDADADDDIATTDPIASPITATDVPDVDIPTDTTTDTPDTPDTITDAPDTTTETDKPNNTDTASPATDETATPE